MENRISLNNKKIILKNIEWMIQEEIARGSSILAYKVFNERYGTAILKEYYPIELELQREEDRIVCEDEEIWEESKKMFSLKMKKFIDMIRMNLVDKMIYNNLPSTMIYENENSSNNTIYILQNYAYGSIYSNMKEETLLELFENICSILHIVNEFHQQGYILFDLKPSNLYVVKAVDQHYFNLIDFDSITKKEDINETLLIKCTHDYHDQTSLDKINEKFDIYSLGCIIKERIKDHDFQSVHPKVNILVNELLEKMLCVQELRYDDQQVMDKLLEIIDYLHIKYFLSTMSLYPKNFFGYENEINEIFKQLNKHKYVCLDGIQGIGKSSIAYEYAYRYQHVYKNIQIVDFKEDWLETFKEFKLNTPIDTINTNFIFSLLNQYESSLFVINNYVFNEQNDQILDLLRKTKIHLLLTSTTCGTIHINGLDKENAILLFKESYEKEIKKSDMSTIEKLISELNYHPGLIELCAKGAKEVNVGMFQSPIKVFISKLHKDVVIQANHRLDSFKQHIFNLLHLHDLSEQEKEILYVLYFGSHLGVSENFLLNYGIDESSLLNLKNKAIIQRNNGTIQLNPLFENDFIRKCFDLNTYVSNHLYDSLLQYHEPNLKCSMIYKMSIVDPMFHKIITTFIKYENIVDTNTRLLETLYQYLQEIKVQFNININLKIIENELLKRQNKIDEIIVKIQNDVNKTNNHSISLERINDLRNKAKQESLKGNLYQSIYYYLQASKLLKVYPFGYIDIIDDCFKICDICCELKSFYQGLFYAKIAHEIILKYDRNNNKLLVRSLLNIATVFNSKFYIADATKTALCAFDIPNLDSNDLDAILEFIGESFHVYANSYNGTDKEDYEILYHLILKIQNVREKLNLSSKLFDEGDIHLLYSSAMFKSGRVVEAVEYLHELERIYKENSMAITKTLETVLNSMLILSIRNYSEIQPKKQELLNLIHYLESEYSDPNLRSIRSKTSFLGEIYAYLIYHFPECNTYSNQQKARNCLKLSIYFYKAANPEYYKKDIDYQTYLLENLGIDYKPYEIEKNVKCKDKEGLLLLADEVNKKLDKIIKIY